MASNVMFAGILGGLACLVGCSSSGGKPSGGDGATGTSADGAAGAGTAGATGAAGSTDAGAAGATGGDGAAGAATTGAAGAVDAGGTAGTGDAGAADGGVAGTTSDASDAGDAGNDITEIAPTTGCGMDPGQALGVLVMSQIMTSGTKDAKCADSKCGAWAYTRDYWVKLPTGYVSTKAYPLVFEGPGCGGQGNNLYTVPDFDSTVIRVGLSPSKDAQAFHATNPGQGCFDDKEGDDSVDWDFYEKVWDKLAGQLCFDKNRVFAAGNASGGSLANELGCKYAGDATRPIRGIMPNNGALPTDPRYAPTCTSKPLAGLWIANIDDVGNQPSPLAYNIPAINRALQVNGCTPASVMFSTATFENFPIGGANADTVCKKILGCPERFPLVVCPIPASGPFSNDTIAVPAFSTFVALFEKAPLLTP
jgi:hypothetical protein